MLSFLVVLVFILFHFYFPEYSLHFLGATFLKFCFREIYLLPLSAQMFWSSPWLKSQNKVVVGRCLRAILLHSLILKWTWLVFLHHFGNEFDLLRNPNFSSLGISDVIWASIIAVIICNFTMEMESEVIWAMNKAGIWLIHGLYRHLSK